MIQGLKNTFIGFVLFLVIATADATIISVKQDGTGSYTGIQAGINAASTGDTVLVWPGTYFENINYNSKSITVASLYLTTGDDAYIHSTIIDGNMNGSCVFVSYCIQDITTLCGFTLQHGSGDSFLRRGGGIYIEESHLIVNYCIIKDNSARSGGGIYATYSVIHLKGSTVKKNIALRRGGGILLVYETQFLFDAENLNSVYCNYGPKGGCDISKSEFSPPLDFVLDTATVLLPDRFFYYSYNSLGYPVNDITWQINHARIEQVNADLYVNPSGDNEKNGLTPDEALQTIAYAIRKILPDTMNPKTIYLSKGTYSPSANAEVFPVTLRSYVSLVGAGKDSTIIDAEYVYPLFDNYIGVSYNSIKEITFRRGIDSQAVFSGNGGLEMNYNENVLLSDIIIEQCKSGFRAGLNANFSNITLVNSKLIENTGGYPLGLVNTGETPKQMIVKNTIIENNGPGATYEDGNGGAVGILGSYSNPGAAKAKLINVRISDNLQTFEPGTINFAVCGLSSSQNAKVDVINSTIGNNVITNPVNSAEVYATEGAEINFYNSIIYGTEDYEIFLGDGQPTSYIATVNVSNTDVKGGAENVQNWNNIHVFNWFNGNIDLDPEWGGADPYGLQEGSPCINAGVPMYEAGMDFPYIKEEEGTYVLYTLTGDSITLPANDLAGNPRISGGRIDMGAYEFQEDSAVGISNNKPGAMQINMSVYPNPFTSNCFIRFSIAKESFINIEVVGMNGEVFKSITANHFPSGDYRLAWNGEDDAGFCIKPGNYLLCLYLDGKLRECEKVIRSK